MLIDTFTTLGRIFGAAADGDVHLDAPYDELAKNLDIAFDEELGYITQPHTSAGRIPTDKGYRFYVDLMMSEKEQEIANMKVMLDKKERKLDTVLKEAAKLIADNTHYASMITTPMIQEKKLKFI